MKAPEPQRQAFAQLLRVEMARHDRRTVELARELDISPESVSSYRVGRDFPLPETAAALAEALMCPKLRELGMWRLECATCGDGFVVGNRGGRPRRYCSMRCQRRAAWQRRQGRTLAIVHRELTVERNENEDRRQAILGHCLECAGESCVCPLLPGCIFIPVTELPKRRRRVA